MASPDYKQVPIVPLSGTLDVESSPDSLPLTAFRFRQNFSVPQENKLARDFGWQRFLAGNTIQANSDLHDQLSQDLSDGAVVLSSNLQTFFDELDPANPASKQVISYPPLNADFSQFCDATLHKRDSALETARQPITMLYTSTATTGQRKFLIGTQTRLYALNEHDGNVKLIGDGFGGKPKLNATGPRFHPAQVGDVVVFTNDYDRPVSWTFDQPSFGCAMRAVSEIPELETIGLSRAAAIYSWKGIIWLGNVEMDGVRISERVVWSDFNNPTSFAPRTGSLRGDQDLGYGEKILAFSEVGDFLVIHTTNGIWAVTAVANAAGTIDFNFRNVYSGGIKREACLSYPNTLVHVGDYAYFAGQDAIYRWTLGIPKPERVEWIHRAAGIMFDDINEAACEAHCAGFDPDTKEYKISWVQKTPVSAWPALCPSRTLSFNLRYEAAHVIDHGFSAFGNWISDSRGTIVSFLLDNCICQSQDELNAALDHFGLPRVVKEGSPCVESNPSCDPDTANWPIWTNDEIVIPGTGGTTTEDYTKAEPDANSLCARLGDLALEDLCSECGVTRLFVMASCQDFCLKQYGGGYYRERFLGLSAAPMVNAELTTKCGDVYANYALDGYRSLLRSGGISFDQPNIDKLIERLTVEYVAEEQVAPLLLRCRIGISSQPVDPNDPKCALLWKELEPVELKCLSLATAAAHEAANTRPNLQADFPMFYTGRYLYYELWYDGRGGEASFSKITIRVKPRKAP